MAVDEQPLSIGRVVLGVTGGIAAYKAAELVRRLREAGSEVQVAMTRSACRFVTPLTFQAVSGRPVRSDLLDPEAEDAMGHIELARWADTVVVAPASADFMARLRAGLADDLLSTLCLATRAPIVLAPAMNAAMWRHPATCDNAATLRERGVRLIGPAEGDQACGETGPGRMTEPGEIVECLTGMATATTEATTQATTDPHALAGRRVLVTAGPTQEDIDPVRFLSNRSSGKMGFAVAAAAAEAGARVELVAGPVALPTPPGVERVDVRSAQQMMDAVDARVENCDIFIGVAAVADYRAASARERKLKKSDCGSEWELALARNPDILAAVAARADRPFTVGFAAETQDVERLAEDKRRRKGADMIAANLVGECRGFDADDNTVTVLWEGGREDLGEASKIVLARRLVALIAERYAQAQGAEG